MLTKINQQTSLALACIRQSAPDIHPEGVMPSKAPIATPQPGRKFVEWSFLCAILLCGAIICVNAACSEQRLTESTESLRLALAGLAVLLIIQHRRLALQRAAARHDRERAADAERIEMALDGGGLGMWEWDLVSGRLREDARAAAMAGRTQDQIESGADWMLEVHPDDRALVNERLARYLDGQAVAFEVEYRRRHANGAWLWMYSRGKAVERDAQGKPLRIVGTRQDIGARKQAEADMHHLAFYDNLTGLPNRRLLLDRLEHAAAKGIRLGHTGAVLFVDLDNFKSLNDTLGHAMGDRLLQQVAHRLQSVVRESDTVARLGGDEFVILLEALDEFTRKPDQRVGVVADKILGALSSAHFLDGHEVHITPSIGITLFGELERSADELLRQADLAMVDAKSAGRNTYRFFAPVLQLTLDEQAKIEAELRHAVRRNELLLHFQPVVDADGRTICLEALLRWNHPERGLLGPGQFIPAAEKSGLILGIGGWVLEHACKQLAAWAGVLDAEGVKVAVNVSARQFRQDDFVDQVMDALQRSGADPRRLKLELTESIVLHDVEEVISKMSLLKAQGICFALDDFGTGYSSLSYLQRLPLDELKIDKSFVHDMLASQNAATIVNAIVGLARSLGMDVVAEGVETESHRHFLASCGCMHYQGYLIAKPLPAERVCHEWLSKELE
jgi:diguanylate cyclase (GGDEF)-like protein/PAS domain S-box-containing protein